MSNSMIAIFHIPTSMWLSQIINENAILVNNPEDIKEDWLFTRKTSLEAHRTIQGLKQKNNYSVKTVSFNSPMTLRNVLR